MAQTSLRPISGNGIESYTAVTPTAHPAEATKRGTRHIGMAQFFFHIIHAR